MDSMSRAAEPGDESEFPHAIGRVARRELAVHGFTRYDQLTRVTAAELLEIHGVGPKAIRILEEELAARDSAFAER
jgi:predicted flap endonuclease-1-like 5' DNA nuclease